MDHEQLFDQAASDKYLQVIDQMAKSKDYSVSHRWGKDKSKDFYLGFHAAIRVIMSILNTKHFEDHLLRLSTDSALLALKAKQEEDKS